MANLGRDRYTHLCRHHRGDHGGSDGRTASGGFTSLIGVENAVGGSGSDTLIDLAGVNNTLTGGAGNDTFVVHDAGDVVSEANGLTGGVDTVQSFVTYTISDVDVENLTLFGTGNINGTGNTAANAMTGTPAITF